MPNRERYQRDKYSTVIDCNHLLIEHLDGKPIPLPRPWTRRLRMTRLLISRKLATEQCGCTRITELGRQQLAAVLAEMTEILLLSYLASIDARYDKSVLSLHGKETEVARVACGRSDPETDSVDTALPPEPAHAL